MDKVLIINTPLTREPREEKEQILPPLGQGYIKTALDSCGIETKLFDAVYHNSTIENILKLIEQEKPTFVGLNVFTPNIDIVKEIIEKIPVEIEIILGAQVIKSVYQEFIDWNHVHKLHLVIGEGELIIPDIVNKCVKESVLYQDDLCTVYNVTRNSCYFPRDLSRVPLDRSIFSDRNMVNHFGLEEAGMISSRGCIYQCAFCGAANAKNKDIFCRVREKEDILEEISQIKRFTPNVSCIRMLDDLFLRNRDSILNAIDVFAQANLKWRAMAHVLSFKNNEDLIPSMAQSGCLELFIGIESGSQKIRDMIHKKGEVTYISAVITKMLESGISVKGYFMYGFPEETESDMKMTYDFAKSIHEISKETKGNFRCSVFQFRPYHGTELYEKILAKGNLNNKFSVDMNLKKWKGRQQFNVISGNYSDCTQEQIDFWIDRTLELNGE